MLRARVVLGLALLAIALPAVADTPVLRYTTYLIVQVDGAPVTVTMHSRPYGGTAGDYTYTDQPTYRVIGASGSQLEDVDAALGSTSTVTVPASAGKFALLELRPRNNYVVAEPAGPYGIVATEHAPMNTSGGFERLHFLVPRGLDAGSIFLHAFSVGEAARAVVYDPDGNVATEVEDDFNEPMAVSFTVPPGQDGRVWSLGLLPPRREDWTIDDCKVWLGPSLPGVLAPQPDWAESLGRPFAVEWTPLLDFEGANPIRTVQWSQAVPEGATLPAYEVGLSDEKPHTGRQSLRVHLRFPDDLASQELKIFTADLPVQHLERVRLWIHGDGSGRRLIIRVRDSSQEHHYCQVGTIDWTGWGEIVADFVSGQVNISGGDENKHIDGPPVVLVIQIGHDRGQPIDSMIYIDDISISP